MKLKIPASLAITFISLAVQAQLSNVIVIGGFDLIRSGSASFPSGDSFSQARTAVLSNYPAAIFTNFNTLAASNLAGVDILVIGTPAGSFSAIDPLTANEQTTLLNFVKAGGAAILLTDNESFSSSANAANNSFLAPFGMGTAGTVGGPAYLPVPSPFQHAVTSGPFGVVSNYTQLAPGGITNLGPYATALVTNNAGAALAVIDPDLIVSGSGAVVCFSDISGFWDTDGFFPTNAAIFLNTIEFCRTASTPVSPLPQLAIDRIGTLEVALHWPSTATNMVLEANTNVANVGGWTIVTNVPVVVGGEEFVTNQIGLAKFYRLKSQ